MKILPGELTFPRGIDSNLSKLLPPQQEQKDRGDVSFQNMLSGALNKVNNLQIESREAGKNLVAGDIESLHQLMIKSEEAKLALQFSMQVTTKVVEAYQELSRMNM